MNNKIAIIYRRIDDNGFITDRVKYGHDKPLWEIHNTYSNKKKAINKIKVLNNSQIFYYKIIDTNLLIEVENGKYQIQNG